MNDVNYSKSVSIIIPVKNECGGIASVIQRVRKYAEEIIVVDGNSTDGTGEIVKKLGVPLLLDHGLGKGDGMKVGIKAAKGDIILFFDGDGSHDEQDIPKMIETITKGEADLVVGSRRTGGSFDINMDFTGIIRAAGCDMLAMLVNKKLHVFLTDILYSFRAIKKDVLERIMPLSDDFVIEQEMIVKCLKKGYKVKEVPSRENARQWGKSKLTTLTGLKFLYLLIKELWVK